jgi:hypothetical protein
MVDAWRRLMAKKKVLSVDTSTTIVESANRVHIDDYRDMKSFRMLPMSERGIERIATELIDWATNNEDALKMTQFYTKHGLNSHTIDRWCERVPFFREAIEHAKKIIGDRREIGALKKKYSESIVSASMAFYDPEWKALLEWRAKLARNEEDSSGVKFVVLEKFPDSPLVAEKKKETT